VKINNDANTRSDLLAALEHAPAAHSVWRGDGYPLYGLGLTDHDQTALGAGVSGISIWNLTGGRIASATGVFANDLTPLVAPRPGTDEVAIVNSVTATGFNPIELEDPRHRDRAALDLGGLTARASSLAWGSDGRWLAAGQQSGDVLVWDVEHPARPPLRIQRYRPLIVQKATDLPLVFPAVAYAGGFRFAVIEQSGEAEIRSPGSTRPQRTYSVGVGAIHAVPADAPHTDQTNFS